MSCRTAGSRAGASTAPDRFPAMDLSFFPDPAFRTPPEGNRLAEPPQRFPFRMEEKILSAFQPFSRPCSGQTSAGFSPAFSPLKTKRGPLLPGRPSPVPCGNGEFLSDHIYCFTLLPHSAAEWLPSWHGCRNRQEPGWSPRPPLRPRAGRWKQPSSWLPLPSRSHPHNPDTR